MASINPLSRELVFKIVYYGPGLGGKTSTLEYLHATTKAEHRGKLISLTTPVDRTLYFDFLPMRLPPLRGMNVRLQIFTVPGQVHYNATRKLVLTGADGLVFVSDSQRVRADANLESLENLRENLSDQGRELEGMPLVFQHNKRELPEILPFEELDRMLNPDKLPAVPSSARSGEGVYEALGAITDRVLHVFASRMPEPGAAIAMEFSASEGGLSSALRDVSAKPGAHGAAIVTKIATVAGGWPSMPPNATIETKRTSASAAPSPGAKEDEATRKPNAAAEEASADDPEITATSDEHLEDFDDEDEVEDDEAVVHGDQVEDDDDVAEEDDDGVGDQDDGDGEVEDDGADAHDEDEDAEDPSSHRVLRDTDASPPGPTFSFAELWPSAEQHLVRRLEEELARGRNADALEICDALVARTFAGAAASFGASDAPRDPAMIPILLGLDGRRYLSFRGLVRRARAGQSITARDAFTAFAFAIEARLARG